MPTDSVVPQEVWDTFEDSWQKAYGRKATELEWRATRDRVILLAIEHAAKNGEKPASTRMSGYLLLAVWELDKEYGI